MSLAVDAAGYERAADGWTAAAVKALLRASACRRVAAQIRDDLQGAQFEIAVQDILRRVAARDEEIVAHVAEALERNRR